MITQYQAAKNICRFFNWQLNQWQLQNLIWFYDVKFFGETGSRLINDHFKKTEFGPILRDLFYSCKKYEEFPVEDFFFCPPDVYNTDEVKFIQKTSEWLLDLNEDDFQKRLKIHQSRWDNGFEVEKSFNHYTNEEMANEYRKDKARFQAQPAL